MPFSPVLRETLELMLTVGGLFAAVVAVAALLVVYAAKRDAEREAKGEFVPRSLARHARALDGLLGTRKDKVKSPEPIRPTPVALSRRTA